MTECQFCGHDAKGWTCDRCDQPCCEDCEIYLETQPATRIDPSDGVGICPDCEAQIDADREYFEERQAENRADARAADREAADDRRW